MAVSLTLKKRYLKYFFWMQNNLYYLKSHNTRTQRWFSTQLPVLNIRFKDFLYTKINWLRFGKMYSINTHLKLKIPSIHKANVLPEISINCLNSPNQIWLKTLLYALLYYVLCMNVFPLSGVGLFMSILPSTLQEIKEIIYFCIRVIFNLANSDKHICIITTKFILISYKK